MHPKCSRPNDDKFLTVRKGRFRKGVTVRPTRFVHGRTTGNYRCMMVDEKVLSDGVFVFNDNLFQFLSFLNTKQPDMAGGGTAVVRTIQHEGHAIGIPTGPFTSLDEIFHNISFPEDKGVSKTRTAREIIDRSFQQIIERILTFPEKTVIYYSANTDNDNIGLGIFANVVGQDVVEYITEKLKNLPQAVEKERYP